MINDGDGTGSLKLEYSSLAELFDDILKKYAQNPMLRSFGVCYTYEQIDELSRNFANYLLHSLHMQKGERIALIMPNLIQMPIAIIGALRAGMVVVNVNPQYTSREIHYQILDSGASTIVILENFADRLSEIIDYTLIKTVIVTKLGDMFANPKRFIFNLINRYFYHGCPEYKFLAKTVTFHHALRHGSRVDYEPQNISLDDLAFLQYTGGTTGTAKGAMLTHHNILANVEQSLGMYGPVLQEGDEYVLYDFDNPSDAYTIDYPFMPADSVLIGDCPFAQVAWTLGSNDILCAGVGWDLCEGDPFVLMVPIATSPYHNEYGFVGLYDLDGNVLYKGACFGASPSGDLTGDGQVDISDVNAAIDVMLGKSAATADVTGDGQVDIADINAIIDQMLGKR